MPGTEVYGPILDGTDVDRGLLAHLRRWMPTYLPYVIRQKEAARKARGEEPLYPGEAPSAANITYTVRHAADQKWPEDQLPMFLAYCPGMSDRPHFAGDGNVRATFDVGLTAIASASDIEATKELAFLLSSAATMCILQHKSLSGLATEVELGAVSSKPFTIVGAEKERSLMAVQLPLRISVQTILNEQEGPAEPIEEPAVEPEDAPTVQTTSATVDLE